MDHLEKTKIKARKEAADAVREAVENLNKAVTNAENQYGLTVNVQFRNVNDRKMYNGIVLHSVEVTYQPPKQRF